MARRRERAAEGSWHGAGPEHLQFSLRCGPASLGPTESSYAAAAERFLANMGWAKSNIKMGKPQGLKNLPASNLAISQRRIFQD